MARSQRLRLLDIAGQVAEIRKATAGLALADFWDDWLLRSAVERGVEVISEASRHLNADLTDQYPDIPWKRVADIGNWLRHAYDRLDAELIWLVVRDHLPALETAVAQLLARQPED